MRVLITITIILGFLGAAFAQQSTPSVGVKDADETITPPKSTQGDKFRSSAERRWQHTKGQYLSKSADPEKIVSEKKPNDPFRNIDLKTSQWISFIVLSALIIGALVLWWFNRTGGGLFRAEAKEDRFTDAVLKEVVGGKADNDIALDDLSYEKLKAINNPKQGLRLLLLHGLKRAAGENNIPLRRSLTTRDIFYRVPEGWRNRAELSNIMAHAEPVLFGGRDLDQQNYLKLLEASKPLFAKSGMRRFA